MKKFLIVFLFLSFNVHANEEPACETRVYMPTTTEFGEDVLITCKHQFEEKYKNRFIAKCYGGTRIHVLKDKKEFILIEMDPQWIGVACDGSEIGEMLPSHGEQGA